MADQATHPKWYANAKSQADAVVTHASDYFKALGVTDPAATGPIPIKIDRTLRNAAYVPKDTKGQYIVIGRYEDGTAYTQSPDVIEHEYGHRIIEFYCPNLSYQGEAGAINEGLADSFACAEEGKNWTIGEGGGAPLRDLANPHSITWDGTHPYPEKRSEEVTTFEDNGGVHINATIVGHASYLMAQQIGRDGMAKVYVHALQEHMFTPNMTFDDLAHDAVKSAGELWGEDSKQQAAVRDAWNEVGYPVSQT
jgi:Zn-dependent metalloprotease